MKFTGTALVFIASKSYEQVEARCFFEISNDYNATMLEDSPMEGLTNVSEESWCTYANYLLSRKHGHLFTYKDILTD